MRVTMFLSVATLAFLVPRTLFLRIRVEGESMDPTYHDGSVAYAIRCKAGLRIGRVIVFDNPVTDGVPRLLIKRTVLARSDCTGAVEYFVDGDGLSSSSSDSFGWVPETTIKGQVIVLNSKDRRTG